MKKNVVKILLPLILFAVVIGCLSCIRNRPPHAVLSPIAEEWYTCDKCNSLDGGIYGKGPLLHDRTASGYKCIHDWRMITAKEFRIL